MSDSIRLTIDTTDNMSMSNTTPRQRHTRTNTSSQQQQQQQPQPILDGPSELKYTHTDSDSDDDNGSTTEPNVRTPLNSSKHTNHNSFTNSSTSSAQHNSTRHSRRVSVASQAFLQSNEPICGVPRVVYRYGLYGLLVSYMIIIPFVLVQVYYIPFYMAFIVMTVAIIPTVFFWFTAVQRAAFYGTLPSSSMPMQRRVGKYISLCINRWQYELYQFLLTCLGCASYAYYTYHLTYGNDDGSANSNKGGTAHYTLNIPSVQSFVTLEYFLMCALSIDYLLHFIVAKKKLSFMISWYSFWDLANFTGVAYFSFLHHGMMPGYELYNVYLFQGPFRFLRARRAIKTLDKPHTAHRAQPQSDQQGGDSGGGSGDAQESVHNLDNLNSKTLLQQHEQYYKLGPFVVSKWSTRVILLVIKVLLYILSTAALILAIEFPCISLVSETARCSNELQSFHLAVYFVVVTLATVGYGDIYAATDLGRMFMIVVIIGAVIQVPAELATFASVQQEHNDIQKLQKARDQQSDTQQQQKQPGGDKDHKPAAAQVSTDVNEHHLKKHTLIGNTSHIDSAAQQSATGSNGEAVNAHAMLTSNSDVSKLHSLLVWSELQLLRNQSTEMIDKLCKTLGVSVEDGDSNAGKLIDALFVNSKAKQQADEAVS